jgi:hemin uptake protein HemP
VRKVQSVDKIFWPGIETMSKQDKESTRAFRSQDLFGDSKQVMIRHNDDWYRLMITKQNKLILVK